jgi:hypothetical protein
MILHVISDALGSIGSARTLCGPKVSFPTSDWRAHRFIRYPFMTSSPRRPVLAVPANHRWLERLSPARRQRQLIKISTPPTSEEQRRCGPARIAEAKKTDVYGDPDFDLICTSHMEHLNGSLRQWCKRLARPTYAFSKKWTT